MEDSAATAALVGIVLALIELVKRLSSKTNGGGTDVRLKNLDTQNSAIHAKLDKLESSFYEFREETRIRWAKSGDAE